MRLAGEAAPSIAAGLVTAEALSSIETITRSLGSRTWSTSVSTIFLPSLLNEYCTVEKMACTENSRRSRTQEATEGSSESWALWPACRNPAPAAVRLDRPRATSKSWENNGCLGTRASAEAISFCSSAEGEQTFRTFTFTVGCCWAQTTALADAKATDRTNSLGNTRDILNECVERRPNFPFPKRGSGTDLHPLIRILAWRI